MKPPTSEGCRRCGEPCTALEDDLCDACYELQRQAAENLHRTRTLAAKRVLTFICSHPQGVTHVDLKANGLTTYGIDRLLALGCITAEQVRDPQRGPRAYHWLWKPNRKADS